MDSVDSPNQELAPEEALKFCIDVAIESIWGLELHIFTVEELRIQVQEALRSQTLRKVSTSTVEPNIHDHVMITAWI
jgi:hypothetical protein